MVGANGTGRHLGKKTNSVHPMLTEGAAEHSCTQEADKENQNTAGLTSTQNPPLISLVSGCDVKLSHFAPPGGYTK